MYCATNLDEDWNAQFLKEVISTVPLNLKSMKRTCSADSEGGFDIEPGTLSDSILNRKSNRFSKIMSQKTLSDENGILNLSQSEQLRQKEARLLAMEQALKEEREKIRHEREQVIQIKEFQEYKENHRRVASYVSAIDEDSEILRELGFIVDSDCSLAEYDRSDCGASCDSGSSLILENFQKDSEEMDQTTSQILEKIQNLQRELDANPFQSFSNSPILECPTFE